MSPRWELTPASFNRLLEALHPDRERAAEKYEKLRLKIGKLLEWRGCPTPGESADAVLDRLAQRLDRGDRVEWIYSYCCGIARMLLLEEQRKQERDAAAHEHFASPASGRSGETEPEIPMEIFERCLGRLPKQGRELVLAYYQFGRDAKIETRKRLADGLAMPLNALRLRVHRLRERLRKCVERHVLGVSDTQR
jgi:DNA-directed RNA polymerase specialized sigma24 family protein